MVETTASLATRVAILLADAAVWFRLAAEADSFEVMDYQLQLGRRCAAEADALQCKLACRLGVQA